MKLLVRIGLRGFLRLERENAVIGDELDFLAAIQDENSSPAALTNPREFKLLAGAESDVCAYCDKPMETDCFRTGKSSAHKTCFKCKNCGKSAWQRSDGVSITCSNCSKPLPGEALEISTYEQYVFLLTVALARLVAVLQLDARSPTLFNIAGPDVSGGDGTERRSDGRKVHSLDDVPRLFVTAEKAKPDNPVLLTLQKREQKQNGGEV